MLENNLLRYRLSGNCLHLCILLKKVQAFLSKYNIISNFSRLLEGLQQNDGIDGLYRYESRERIAIPGGALRPQR